MKIMSKKKLKRDEGEWCDIKIRKATRKRLGFFKNQMEAPLYNDVINYSLNLLEKDFK
jgi:hypothetical protein